MKTRLSPRQARLNPNPFNPGDRVAYRAEFLKSAGMHTGWAPFARGEISEINGILCVIKWDDAPPSSVNCGNLVREDKIHLESN